MARLRPLLLLLALFPASAALAQTGPNPEERSFQLFIDGVLTPGVVGYRIEFNSDPVTRTDSRRLDTAYSPDRRRFVITVTQKGLNRLQDWLNAATAAGNSIPKSVSLVVRNIQDQVLARWELTVVQPATFSSAGAGVQSSVTATIEFSYATLTLVQADPN